MSTLTTEERLALDEIFLSMAVSPSPFGTIKKAIVGVSKSFQMNAFSERRKVYSVRKTLVSARMFVRTGLKTCSKRLRFKR